MTRIKICGLKTIEDIQAVNRWKPDFAGFVFAPGKRQITLEQAAELRRALDSKIQAVGVFVNAPLEEATALADAGVIQLIVNFRVFDLVAGVDGRHPDDFGSKLQAFLGGDGV